MILDAFFKSLAQFGDPRFRAVLIKGVGLTFALLFAAYAAVFAAANVLIGPEITLPFIGPVTWVDNLVSWGSLVLMLLLSVVLMVPVASAITSMFLDEVAQAVEDRHFPHLPPAQPVPFWGAVKDTVNFLGVLIFANAVALILYLLLAPAAPFIFWALNGFLLGREYFTLAASRRIGLAAARQMRSKHAGMIWFAGALMAVPLSIPLVNLVVPILGAATFTHVFHNLHQRSEPARPARI